MEQRDLEKKMNNFYIYINLDSSNLGVCTIGWETAILLPANFLFGIVYVLYIRERRTYYERQDT